MSAPQSDAGWLALTPAGALQAFAQRQPDETAQALQALLGTSHALTQQDWFAAVPAACGLFEQALAKGWIERLPRPLAGPNVRLDDFVQHVVASLSGDRDAELLLPEVSFVPFWIDGTGYWIILCGEPLLNNPALVELCWGIQGAGSRFLPAGH